MKGFSRKQFSWVNWVFKEAFVIQDAICGENIQERKNEAEQLPLHCWMSWNLSLDLSCLFLSVAFQTLSDQWGFFSFGWEIKVGFASRCEGRVHHLQRIMRFLKKGKAEIPLAGGWGSVSPRWRRMSWEGQWGNVPLCWIWHSAGAFVGELDRNIVLGAWLGLPSLGSSSWLHTSPTRSASFPCTQPCGAVKHHFQRKF